MSNSLKKEDLYQKRIDLINDFLIYVMHKALNAPLSVIESGTMIVYLEVEYRDAREICGTLQDYINKKLLNKYLNADYTNPTSIYEPGSAITLQFNKKYLNQTEEIIISYKLMEQNE